MYNFNIIIEKFLVFSCFEANLNGNYFDEPTNNFRGVIWEKWSGNNSLKSTIMMVRERGENEVTSTLPYYLEDP